MAPYSIIPSAELPEIAGDLRAVFDELASRLRHEQRAYSGECRPALDVLETHEAVEIVVDLAGVSRDAVRVLFRAGIVIVAGEKAPPAAGESQAFHLIEREFGRFARAVRLTGAVDVAKSRATLQEGELRVVLPKIAERRGGVHEIAIA